MSYLYGRRTLSFATQSSWSTTELLILELDLIIDHVRGQSSLSKLGFCLSYVKIVIAMVKLTVGKYIIHNYTVRGITFDG